MTFTYARVSTFWSVIGQCMCKKIPSSPGSAIKKLCLLWVSENIWTLSVHIVSKPSFTEMERSLLDFFTKTIKSAIPECPNQSVCKEIPTISDKVHKTCPEQIQRNKKPPWNQYKERKLDVQTITAEHYLQLSHVVLLESASILSPGRLFFCAEFSLLVWPRVTTVAFF